MPTRHIYLVSANVRACKRLGLLMILLATLRSPTTRMVSKGGQPRRFRRISADDAANRNSRAPPSLATTSPTPERQTVMRRPPGPRQRGEDARQGTATLTRNRRAFNLSPARIAFPLNLPAAGQLGATSIHVVLTVMIILTLGGGLSQQIRGLSALPHTPYPNFCSRPGYRKSGVVGPIFPSCVLFCELGGWTKLVMWMGCWPSNPPL